MANGLADSTLGRGSRVQNSAPHRFSELPRDAPPILANYARVNSLRDSRAVGVAEPLLSQLQRCAKAVHQRGIRMPEGMEIIPVRQPDVELSADIGSAELGRESGAPFLHEINSWQRPNGC